LGSGARCRRSCAAEQAVDTWSHSYIFFVCLIRYFGMPSTQISFTRSQISSSSALFLTLLERQCPLDTLGTTMPTLLSTCLAVHVFSDSLSRTIQIPHHVLQQSRSSRINFRGYIDGPSCRGDVLSPTCLLPTGDAGRSRAVMTVFERRWVVPGL
jgi:hypothetical protein